MTPHDQAREDLDKASEYLTRALRSIRSISDADQFALIRSILMDSANFSDQPVTVQIEVRDALEDKRLSLIAAAVTP